MISLKSWSVLSCVRIQNIFTCESFANFLTTFASGVGPGADTWWRTRLQIVSCGHEVTHPDKSRRCWERTFCANWPFTICNKTCFYVNGCVHFVELVGYFSRMIFSPGVTGLRRRLTGKIYISTLLKVQSTIWTEPDVTNKYLIVQQMLNSKPLN